METKIIFLDVSGSMSQPDIFYTSKEMLKALIKKTKKQLVKDYNIYVVFFSEKCYLLPSKVLEQIFSGMDLGKLGIISSSTSGKAILNFFPHKILNEAEIEIITDGEFEEQELDIEKKFQKKGAFKVTIYSIDRKMAELIRLMKIEPQTKRVEKEKEDKFKPTFSIT